MKNLSSLRWLLIALLMLSWLPHPALAMNVEALRNADQTYKDGDCKVALDLYRQIEKDSNESKSHHELALFRMGYCQLTAGDYAGAEGTFRQYVLANPSNEEARTRFAESLLENGHYEEALAQSKMV